MKLRTVSLILLLASVCAQADHLTHMDTDMAWPLCGRITENPPQGWMLGDDCPADRFGNPDHTDAPFSSTFGPRLLKSGADRYDFHRGVDIATPIGTPVFAIADGYVDHAGQGSFSDPHIKVKHYRPGHNTCGSGDGCYYAMYLHMSGWENLEGQNVVKGQYLGLTGESSSGFDHLHWEIRDAPAFNTSSAWQRDCVHPFTGLPYNEPNHTAITFTAVDQAVPNNPVPTLRVFGNRYDLVSVEMTVYDQNMQEVIQPGNTPDAKGYHVNPPFWDMETWNFEYSHKNSSPFTWASFGAGGAHECPYHAEHPMSYTAHAHLDDQDPMDIQQGLFNGVHLITNKYWLVGTKEYDVTVEFRELVGPAECMVADAVFSTGVVSTARWGNCPHTCSANRAIPDNEWHFFSLPCDPGSANEVQDLLSGLIAGDYGQTWVVYRFDMGVDNWVLMNVDEKMWPGSGYIIYTANATNLSYQGWDNNENDIPLLADGESGRFNLVGSVQDDMLPWNQALIENQGGVQPILDADPMNDMPPPVGRECSMDPVGDDCRVSSVMYKWNGNVYESFNGVTPLLEGEINKGDAIWVESFSHMARLRQPTPMMPSPAAMNASTKNAVQKGRDDTQWFMRLTVSSGSKQDRNNAIGQIAGSVDGLDGNDLPELRPFGSQYLSLVFDNEDLPPVDWGYTSDFREPGVVPKGAWPILVRSSSDVDEITLRWEGEAELFKGARLRDEDSGKLIPLKPGGFYQFKRNEKGNRLTLLIR